MTDTLLTLQKKIPEKLAEILRIVFGISEKLNIKIFVIGAFARDLIFEYVYEAQIQRATQDIDFGVAVGSWEQYEQFRQSLIETGQFKDDKRIEQRVYWKGGSVEMKIDLVPYGGVENQAGEIAFPPDEYFVMNMSGFAEAFENSISLQIEKDLIIRIASLPGLVLLKFIAYNDRPQERKRDVQDIWFIAQNYLEADNLDRLYEDNDLLNEKSFDYRTAGARILGRDVSLILNAKTREIILQLLTGAEDGGRLQTFADIISRNNLRDENEYSLILETLRQMRLGIEE